ncbi:sigma 54-interacting transcriptional regulator [uncultured Lamprocystis sp.]|uniref:sigma 54-interacting transcriptional regulator n=1 Tax=uncultured Lamprocystis sp. TaxID=543132 RepID=UPI0025DC593B|nr:sigma 54-interacting transcriptional regulator [uncultured Lamprocystis sp.]
MASHSWPHEPIGHIKAASGGTLFLDEIGDMPLESQGVMLRFIEDQLVTPLGSTQSSLVDVRLVAATNQDLQAAIRDRRFRADLFYRLAVCVVRTPSLCDREGDIELLAKHYLDEAIVAFGRTPGASLSNAALAGLYQHPWPGNLRELRSTIFQAVIDGGSRHIGLEDLNVGGKSHRADAQVRRDRGSLKDARHVYEKRSLETSLARNRSNVAQAAKDLGISRMTLYRLMAKHGVSRDNSGNLR